MAIEKYGLENFEFTVVEECEAHELNEREEFWIREKDSYRNGYNMVEKVKENCMFDESVKAKHYAAIHTEAYVKKHSEDTIDRYYSEDNAGNALRKINESRMRKIRCVETGEIFPSMRECARRINLPRQSLTKHLKGMKKYATLDSKTYEFLIED